MLLERTKSDRGRGVGIKIETTNLKDGGVKHEFFVVMPDTSENVCICTHEPIGMITFHDNVYIFTSYLWGHHEYNQTGHPEMDDAMSAAGVHGRRMAAWLDILVTNRPASLEQEDHDLFEHDFGRPSAAVPITFN